MAVQELDSQRSKPKRNPHPLPDSFTLGVACGILKFRDLPESASVQFSLVGPQPLTAQKALFDIDINRLSSKKVSSQ